MQPTDSDIITECTFLRARRARDLTRGMSDELETLIDVLTGHLDFTAPEFSELSYQEQRAALHALAWKDGISKKRPSEYWKQ